MPECLKTSSGNPLKTILILRMTTSDAQNLIVRMGDHNLNDLNDAKVVEKRVKLIVKNKLFSMQSLVIIFISVSLVFRYYVVSDSVTK